MSDDKPIRPIEEAKSEHEGQPPVGARSTGRTQLKTKDQRQEEKTKYARKLLYVLLQLKPHAMRGRTE